MFVNTRPTFGYHWKYLSMYRYIFLITILQVHEVLAETDLLGTTTTNGITTGNGTTCKERWTCSSCTEATTPACSWFVAEQICADSTAVAARSRMVVTDGSSCPKFTIYNSVSTEAGMKMTAVTVKVNDGNMEGDFVHLLANSSVECQLDNNDTYTAKVDGDRISCSWISPRTHTSTCRPLISHTNHLLIVFDGKLLRFDNVSDHYVSKYPGGDDCPNVECPHCHWNNGTHRFYCSWCSVNNSTSTYIYQYCDVRNISSLVRLSAANMRDDEMCSGKGPVVIKYSVTPKMSLQSDQPPGFGCQVYNNSSPVDPSVDDGQVFSGITSGGTTLRVQGQHFCGLWNVKCCVENKSLCGQCDVRNDKLMVCRSPKLDINLLYADETHLLRFYANNFTVNFRSPLIGYHLYQDPVFTDFVVDGCCNVTVNGLYPDQGFAAYDLSILLVAENSSSLCQVTSMNRTQIVCNASQSSSLKLGPSLKQINVTIGNNLNGSVSMTYFVTPKIIIQSDHTSSFVCQARNNSFSVDPSVDDGQVFGGIAAGGTVLRVHGEHFCGLQNVKFCVSNKRSCGRCVVRNDTLMICRSPSLFIDPRYEVKMKPLRLYAKNSTGNMVKFKLPSINYRLYNNPIFTDFVLDGCCNVTINGFHLNEGYGAEELTIELIAESWSSRCLVISINRTQIICKLSQSPSPQFGASQKQIIIMIGDNLKVSNNVIEK